MLFVRLSFRPNAGRIGLAAFFRTGPAVLGAVLLATTLLAPTLAEAQPTVQSITLNNGYGSNNEWFGDQKIIATVTFSAAVDVVYSPASIQVRPGLQLLVGDNSSPNVTCGSENPYASNECIVYMQLELSSSGCSGGTCNNVTSLKFGWTPNVDFTDTDGIVIPQNALANNNGSTIKAQGTNTDVNLSHSAYSGPTRKVDGGRVRTTASISKQTFIKGLPSYAQLPPMSRGPAIGNRGITYFLFGPGRAYHVFYNGVSLNDKTGLVWDDEGAGSCGTAHTICGTPTTTLSSTTYQYQGRFNAGNSANSDFNIEVLDTPTAWIDSTASSPASLTEDNLNGATVVVKLANVTYVAGGTDRFEITGPPGVSIASISGGGAGSTRATLTLVYDNTDFDTDQTLALKVKAAGHSGSSDLTTSKPANSAASVKASLPVAHVVEATPGRATIASATPGVESLALKWNTVTGATSYKVQWKYGSLSYNSSRQATVTAPDTSYTITNLTGVQHTVRVIATNSKAVTPDGTASLESTGTPIVPSLSINSPSVAEGPDGASATLTYTVTLNPASSNQVTVAYAEGSGGTATQGTDYTALSGGTLTFRVGQTDTTITVSVTGDNTDEPDETVVVTLSSPTNATIATATGTGTITDDDDPPSLSISSPSVVEGPSGASATLTYTVTLSAASGKQVTVDYAEGSGGTATQGTDYTALSGGTLTFRVGQTDTTITVSVTGDETDEVNETVEVTLSNPTNATISTSTGTGTIIDDDGAPSLSISSPSIVEGPSGATAILTYMVTLSPASGQQVTVDYAEGSGGTATSGTDYTALTGGTLTFRVGQTDTTITVSVTGDDTDEPNETIVVTLSNPTNTTIATATGTGTISDDDDPPSLSISSPSVAEGPSGASATLTYTVTLSATSGQQVTVAYAESSDGRTATQGTDYTALSGGTLAFRVGQTDTTITVSVAGDETDETDETVVVTLSSPTNATIATATGTGTITDDDPTPSVTLILTPQAIGENGGTTTVTARLSGTSSVQTTVTVSAVAVSPAVAGGFALSENAVLTIAAGATTSTGEVTIATVDDEIDSPNKQVTVSGTTAGGHGAANPDDATLTIEDDEGPPTVRLVLTSPQIPEFGGTSTVVATMNRASSVQTTVTVSAVAVSPAVAGGFALSENAVLTIAAGATTSTGEVTITAVDDEIEGPGKTVTVSGVSAGGDGVENPASVTLTILPNTVPSFTDGVDPQRYEQFVAISPLTLPGTTGGEGTLTYSMDTPPGLVYTAPGSGDDHGGVLSGTPTEAIEKTRFTVIATDGEGESGSLSFFITVVRSQPSYGVAAVAAQNYVRDREIETLTLPGAKVQGGALTYSLTPALPSGLSFNAATREISGTPLEAIDETEYTLTATDEDGDVETLTFTISVVVNLIPSFGDTVAVAAQNYIQNRTIAALALPAATGGNGVLTYALAPALPSGLSFDATTRELFGVPLEAMAKTEFALNATDRDGDVGTLAFTISVVADSIPTFGDTTVVAQSYVLNREIEALTLPEATGGNGTLLYVLLPALPSGLSFDMRTRELSGTPLEAMDETEYTLTALDVDGDTASLTFTLEVQEATADFDGNGGVDFMDFLSFAGKFGMRQGDAGYDARYDLDGDGEIGFSDFLIFAGSFGDLTGG